MKELRTLKHSHKNAIRYIVVGGLVKDAAKLIGVSPTYMSSVYRSREGRDFELYLHAKADEYVARMMALGLVPELIRDAIGRPERRKGRR